MILYYNLLLFHIIINYNYYIIIINFKILNFKSFQIWLIKLNLVVINLTSFMQNQQFQSSSPIKAEEQVQIIVEGQEHFISLEELHAASEFLYKIHKMDSKPVIIRLPEWVKKTDLLLLFSVLKNVKINIEYKQLIAVYRVAVYFGNVPLQRTVIHKCILPCLKPDTLPQAFCDGFILKNEVESNQALGKFLYDQAKKKLIKHLLSLKKSTLQYEILKKIKHLLPDKFPEICRDLLPILYESAGNSDKDLCLLIETHMHLKHEQCVVDLLSHELKQFLENAISEIDSNGKRANNVIYWTEKTPSSPFLEGGRQWSLIIKTVDKNEQVYIQHFEPKKDSITPSKENANTSKPYSKRNNSYGKIITPLGKGRSRQQDASSTFMYGPNQYLSVRKKGVKKSVPLSQYCTNQSRRKCPEGVRLSREASTLLQASSEKTSVWQPPVLCLLSYIELGTGDPEAKLNIHYINSNESSLLM